MILNSVKRIFLVLCMFVLISSITACSQNKENEGSEKRSSEMKLVSVKDINSDTQIIDIRDEEYFIGWKNGNGISGHIENAVDFPISWIKNDANKEKIDTELNRRKISKDKKTILYSDDTISGEDYAKYQALGFKDLYVLEGGISAYSKENGKLAKLEGYQMYVSPRWVEELIADKKPEGYNGEKYKIVEVSLPSEKDEYANGHIKGAINFNSDEINHIPGPRTIQEYEGISMDKQLKFWGFPDDKDIKSYLESKGIDSNTMVILYATEKATTAANRAALVMDYAGVKNIKLINGGKPLWILENRGLDKTIEKSDKVDFGVDVPQNPKIVIKSDEERRLVDDKNAVIASVRSFDEYLGKMSGYTYIEKAGDIKNSRFAYAGSNPYAMEDYRNLDNTMFNYELCKERWNKWGIKEEKMVSFHCGTGWRASETYYIAKALGWKNIGVYVGGWYEWSKLPNAPVKPEGLPTDAPEKQPEEYFYDKE